jgi:hypothetical protein
MLIRYSMAKNYITIIDNTGRNVLGELSNETDTTVDILNPVMITVQPQNNQFQVQLIPLFLAEFIAINDKGRNFTYTYHKSNVAIGKNFNIDPRITTQYDKIIEASNASKPTVKQDTQPEVIKLFE